MSKVCLSPLAFAGALALAGPAQGQVGEAGTQVPAATADVEVELERARDAQRSFERTRRRHFARGVWATDACHEHIGRFCLNHDDDRDWTPEPEAPEVGGARLWLLATLDSVAQVVGDQEWLLGQRVAYRLEAGRSAEALALLDTCAAPRTWCSVLLGFALQETGRYAEAEAAFDRALAGMEPEERCRWTDITTLLERPARRTYERLECDSAPRRSYERSFWHLSDPSWLVAGLELRSEHLARRVRSMIQTDAASGYGLPWGRDVDELTMRYGWPAGWDVAWRRIPGVRTERSIQAHRFPEAQSFVVDDLTGGGDSPGPVWALESARPRSTWAPRYGRVHDMPHQVAGFRRDDERIVVAAFDAPSDLDGCAVESALFLANAFGIEARAEGQGTFPLRVHEPPAGGAATLFGIEMRCLGGKGVARARASLPPGSELLSDLLLLEPAPDLPSTLEAALPRARRSSNAGPGESVVVFWEWYAPPEPEGALAITLSLTREDKSFLRKALEWTGLADRDREEVGIRWSEPGGGAAAARSVELQLPNLAPGRYRLTLEVRSARAGTVASEREITIVP